MKRLFNFLIELAYWILIMLSPTLTGVIVGAIIYFNYSSSYVALTVIGIGFITGILLAERIRKRTGCSNFFGRLYA